MADILLLRSSSCQPAPLPRSFQSGLGFRSFVWSAVPSSSAQPASSSFNEFENITPVGTVRIWCLLSSGSIDLERLLSRYSMGICRHSLTSIALSILPIRAKHGSVPASEE